MYAYGEDSNREHPRSSRFAVSLIAVLPSPRHLKGHPTVITTLVFLAPDQVVSTSEDRTIRLWDTARGEERASRALQNYNGNVWYTAISADGQWLAGGGGDQSVRLWNLHNGDLVRSLHGHAQGVMALAVTSDGTKLAADATSLTAAQRVSLKALGAVD